MSAGDQVTASRNLVNFAEATVEKIDDSLGFYHVRCEGDDETKLLPFGGVTTDSLD